MIKQSLKTKRNDSLRTMFHFSKSPHSISLSCSSLSISKIHSIVSLQHMLNEWKCTHSKHFFLLREFIKYMIEVILTTCVLRVEESNGRWFGAVTHRDQVATIFIYFKFIKLTLMRGSNTNINLDILLRWLLITQMK